MYDYLKVDADLNCMEKTDAGIVAINALIE